VATHAAMTVPKTAALPRFVATILLIGIVIFPLLENLCKRRKHKQRDR
jgi:hypothetical protein